MISGLSLWRCSSEVFEHQNPYFTLTLAPDEQRLGKNPLQILALY